MHDMIDQFLGSLSHAGVRRRRWGIYILGSLRRRMVLAQRASLTLIKGRRISPNRGKYTIQCIYSFLQQCQR